MKHDDFVYLGHIRECIGFIEDDTKGATKRAFLKKRPLQDVVIRRIEIIGEAAKHLSREFRNVHQNIPWSDIAGMRDKLIHGYFGVSLSVVWEVVKKDIPRLKKNIEAILNERVDSEQPSPYLLQAMKEAEEDLKKGRVSPTFNNAEDAIAYLNRFKKKKQRSGVSRRYRRA